MTNHKCDKFLTINVIISLAKNVWGPYPAQTTRFPSRPCQNTNYSRAVCWEPGLIAEAGGMMTKYSSRCLIGLTPDFL